MAILPYLIGGFGEIDSVSAVRSGKATEIPAGMSDAKIAIKVSRPNTFFTTKTQRKKRIAFHKIVQGRVALLIRKMLQILQNQNPFFRRCGGGGGQKMAAAMVAVSELIHMSPKDAETIQRNAFEPPRTPSLYRVI